MQAVLQGGGCCGREVCSCVWAAAGLQIRRDGVENGGGADWKVDRGGHIGIIGGFCLRPADDNRADVRVMLYVSAC